VAQRLDVRFSPLLLDGIARHASDLIVFSAAEPGQPEHGHVNCQLITYWLERWAERGWIPDLVDSFGMRCIATMSWFRRNLVVLRRRQSAAGAQAAAALAAIAARPFRWYGQAAGIRHNPFLDPLPAALAGYTSCNDSRP
jgi:hypothetical protein